MKGPQLPLLCNLLRSARCPPHTSRQSFADYWKDAGDQGTYLERSRWLADVNNEREAKNDEYKQRMLALERYVLVEAVNDTTVSPHVVCARASNSVAFDPLRHPRARAARCPCHSTADVTRLVLIVAEREPRLLLVGLVGPHLAAA